MLKRAAIVVMAYLFAVLIAGILAAVVALPFLRSGDFSVWIQMLIMAMVSGGYILAFVPLVIVIEFLARHLRTHLAVPLAAIPTFGAAFTLLGYACFPEHWWPLAPLDMKLPHLEVVLPLALFSIGVGMAFTLVRSKCAVVRNRHRAMKSSWRGNA